jgi:hypothetical protein
VEQGLDGRSRARGVEHLTAERTDHVVVAHRLEPEAPEQRLDATRGKALRLDGRKVPAASFHVEDARLLRP